MAKRSAARAINDDDAPRPDASFSMPHTVGHSALLRDGGDADFREQLYLMVLAFGRLQDCRHAFGQAIGLTGAQYTVLIGAAYRQGRDGVSIRTLAEHVHLAPTHVTTEVGRLIRKGLLSKRPNAKDRRGVLVRVSRKGEAALLKVAPLLREINDILFADVGRAEFAALRGFLDRFAANSERAVDELQRRKDA